MSFTTLGVPRALADRLAARGIHEPFPVQAATLPDALAGRDVCGRAPTGSGKTLAFGLALAARAGDRRAAPGRPRFLVLVPTRELAAQVRDELTALLGPGRAMAVYGGTGYEAQRRSLARGVDVVVACPGRLEDLLASRVLTLDAVEVVVVDEADRMADMGFLPPVRRLLDLTPADRQTLLFSATLDGEVQVLVDRYQREAAHHDVTPPGDDAATDVVHLVWPTPQADRVKATASAVRQYGRTVVFCRTRHGADRVAKQLAAAGVEAVAIHGARSQGQRDRALAAFTAGRADALVATDVAARGIHVDGVACVVHFDPAGGPKDYVHRSGRTGRAGNTGVVVSLVADGQRGLVRSLLKAAGVEPGEAPATPQRAAASASSASGAALVASASASTAAAAASTAASTAAEEPQRRALPEARPQPARGARQGRVAPGERRTARATTRTAVRTPGRPARPAEREHAPERRGGSTGQGTVKFFDRRKGYGFIERTGATDLFVHSSAAPGDLQPGQQVRFTIRPGRAGSEAHDVTVVR